MGPGSRRAPRGLAGMTGERTTEISGTTGGQQRMSPPRTRGPIGRATSMGNGVWVPDNRAARDFGDDKEIVAAGMTGERTTENVAPANAGAHRPCTLGRKRRMGPGSRRASRGLAGMTECVAAGMTGLNRDDGTENVIPAEGRRRESRDRSSHPRQSALFRPFNPSVWVFGPVRDRHRHRAIDRHRDCRHPEFSWLLGWPPGRQCLTSDGWASPRCSMRPSLG